MALARWQATIADDEGNVQPSASVEVRSEVTGNLVPIYSDREGADQISNPMTADSEGFAFFHVLGGAYKIVATKGSFTTGDRWRYVPIGTAQEFDFEALLGDPTAPTVITDAGDVLATTSDRVIVINKDTPEATAVTLPSSAAATTPITIKDGAGDASDNPITISPQSGSPAETIDGKASIIINFDFGSITLEPYRDGSGWFRT